MTLARKGDCRHRRGLPSSPMMADDNEIAKLLSRVHRSADGMWHVFFQGRLVYDQPGRMREFASEKVAEEYLARCKRAGRIVD